MSTSSGGSVSRLLGVSLGFVSPLLLLGAWFSFARCGVAGVSVFCSLRLFGCSSGLRLVCLPFRCFTSASSVPWPSLLSLVSWISSSSGFLLSFGWRPPSSFGSLPFSWVTLCLWRFVGSPSVYVPLLLPCPFGLLGLPFSLVRLVSVPSGVASCFPLFALLVPVFLSCLSIGCSGISHVRGCRSFALRAPSPAALPPTHSFSFRRVVPHFSPCLSLLSLDNSSSCLFSFLFLQCLCCVLCLP